MDFIGGVSSLIPGKRKTTRTNILGRLRSSTLLVSLLALALLLAGCGTLDSGGGSNTGSSSQQNNGGDMSGHVHIVGSTALLPLAAKAADLFHQQNPHVQIDATGGGSVTGLKAVTSQKADIGDSDIYADPALYPDPNLTDHIVCVAAFTLIVDPQITLTSLSTQQIIDIFTGKTTNWKSVGGPDVAIATVIRPSTSGTRALFRKYVLGGLSEAGQPLTSDSSTAVLDLVAHTPGAIGYVTTTLVNPTVKAIAIDGYAATQKNIQSGQYKFWGYEHMYTLQNGINATTAFLDFMQTPAVQQMALKLGYIPVSSIKSALSHLPSLSGNTDGNEVH
jgi:phosphate transport system substrate-binding protein